MLCGYLKRLTVPLKSACILSFMRKVAVLSIALVTIFLNPVSAHELDLPESPHLRLAILAVMKACAHDGGSMEICYRPDADMAERPALKSALENIYALGGLKYQGLESLMAAFRDVRLSRKAHDSSNDKYPEWSYKFHYLGKDSYIAYVTSFIRLFCQSREAKFQCFERGKPVREVSEVYSAIYAISGSSDALEEYQREKSAALATEYISIFMSENPGYAQAVERGRTLRAY